MPKTMFLAKFKMSFIFNQIRRLPGKQDIENHSQMVDFKRCWCFSAKAM